jgi:hypothetical protein
VVVAVRADELLTERQKEVLIDIYASFRKEAEAALTARAAATEPVPVAAPKPSAAGVD